eukprot:scaffold4217_cov78-Skeletonema_marinoi.AAC.7
MSRDHAKVGYAKEEQGQASMSTPSMHYSRHSLGSAVSLKNLLLCTYLVETHNKEEEADRASATDRMSVTDHMSEFKCG